MPGEDLLSDDAKPVRVENAIARTMNFQNLEKAHKNFKELKLDLAGTLKKPYRRRRESLYQSLEKLIATRHDLIHRASIDETLSEKRIEKAIKDVQSAMRKFYEHIIQKNGWQANDQG